MSSSYPALEATKGLLTKVTAQKPERRSRLRFIIATQLVVFCSAGSLRAEMTVEALPGVGGAVGKPVAKDEKEAIKKEEATKSNKPTPPADSSPPKQKDVSEKGTTKSGSFPKPTLKELDSEKPGVTVGVEAESAPSESTEPDTVQAPSSEPTPPNYEEREGQAEQATASHSQAPGTDQEKDDYADAAGAQTSPEKTSRKNFILGVALDVTLPLGSLRDFISAPSVQGFSLDVRYYAWGNLGVGLAVAFDSLSEKSEGTLEWKNATITGTQVKEMSMVPILAKGYYAWRDTEKFEPYVALGAGANRTVRRVAAGYSTLSDANWQFAVVPEVGLHVPVGPTVLLANARFNYLAAGGGIDQQILANLSIGITVQ